MKLSCEPIERQFIYFIYKLFSTSYPFRIEIKLLSTATCANGTVQSNEPHDVMFSTILLMHSGWHVDGGSMSARPPRFGDKLDIEISRRELAKFEVCSMFATVNTNKIHNIIQI